MVKLRVGTRGSNLAVAQTQIVLDMLIKKNPHIDFEVAAISTKGDVDKRPLFTMDQKGIFERDVNEAAIKGEVDFTVHSLKDIPSDLSNELIIACIPRRARPNDALVNKKKLKLSELRAGSIIGTSSLRRAIQIMRKRPDLTVKAIRGNVETRVNKSTTGEYDAIILAEAGLTRLGMKDTIAERFNIKDFVPAPGQGAIAIVCRRGNQGLIKILKGIEDYRSKAEIDAERALLTKIEAGCRFPVGAVAIMDSNLFKIRLYASVFSADGKVAINLKDTGNIKNAAKLGIKVGTVLLNKGAPKLAEGWREAIEEWNKKL
jgi:hydroxymethylbilane synthase